MLLPYFSFLYNQLRLHKSSRCTHRLFDKACVHIFYQIFISNQMIAFQKAWKMFFILSKKLFPLSRYLSFCILVSPFFFPVSHCTRDWSKINLKVYDIINCLNKTLITHFVWYHEKKKRYNIEAFPIDWVSIKEHFNGKIIHKMCTKS